MQSDCKTVINDTESDETENTVQHEMKNKFCEKGMQRTMFFSMDYTKHYNFNVTLYDFHDFTLVLWFLGKQLWNYTINKRK